MGTTCPREREREMSHPGLCWDPSADCCTQGHGRGMPLGAFASLLPNTDSGMDTGSGQARRLSRVVQSCPAHPYATVIIASSTLAQREHLCLQMNKVDAPELYIQFNSLQCSGVHRRTGVGAP